MEAEHQDAGALFREHEAFVTRFLISRGTPEDEVPDLVQEVFLLAHRKGGFVEDEAKATTWLAAIARRVEADRRKKGKRVGARQLFDLEAVARALAPTTPATDQVAAKEQLRRVRRALRLLPGSKRSVFVMFECEGRSCREIGEVLKIPVGTVYSRLHDAREKFLEHYHSDETQRPLALSDSITFVSLGVRALV